MYNWVIKENVVMYTKARVGRLTVLESHKYFGEYRATVAEAADEQAAREDKAALEVERNAYDNSGDEENGNKSPAHPSACARNVHLRKRAGRNDTFDSGRGANQSYDADEEVDATAVRDGRGARLEIHVASRNRRRVLYLTDEEEEANAETDADTGAENRDVTRDNISSINRK